MYKCYAVVENRDLVSKKGKGTAKFLYPLTVHGPFQSFVEAESMYGTKLNYIMGFCRIIEVHESQEHAFFSWVNDVTNRYRAGTLPQSALPDEIQSATLRFYRPGESV
jgi:hypothetical protein